MKTKLLALLLVAAFPFASFAADEVPKPFTLARYQAMMDRSLFAVATAVAAPVAAPNFAKDLFVANAARSNDGDLVTIASSADKNFKKYLSTAAPVDGFSISNVEWSEKVGATKVTIAKDGQFATLSFNQALLTQPISGGQNQNPQPPVVQQQPQPQPGVAGQPGTNAPGGAPPMTLPKAMPVPSLPSPPPRVRGVIPRNPVATAPPVQAVPIQAPTPEVEL